MHEVMQKEYWPKTTPNGDMVSYSGFLAVSYMHVGSHCHYDNHSYEFNYEHNEYN